MAKVSTQSGRIRQGKGRRKGVHAKTKASKDKSSKVYIKLYRGQGR